MKLFWLAGWRDQMILSWLDAYFELIQGNSKWWTTFT